MRKKTNDEKLRKKAEKIVMDARFYLTKYLLNEAQEKENDQKIGIWYSKREFRFIKENLDLIKKIGLRNNLRIYVSDTDTYMYVEYIQEIVFSIL